MIKHKIVLLSGDGIGPEISEVAKQILHTISNKHDFKIEIDERLFGGKAIEKYNSPLPDDTLKACIDSESVLLAAIGDPKYDSMPRNLRPETGLLKLRSALGLFANIRPVKVLPSLLDASSLKSEIIKDVDLIVVRELTGGIYFGEPKGKIISNNEIRAFNTMVYSDSEVDRISKIAFELANGRRKKVCSVDKANVLEVSQLWRDRTELIGKNYPQIELTHQYVDNAAMQLVRNPGQFDVILTGNLFGDIISDEAAMITGSIGMLPSASINNYGPGLFEPVHGSAPDIAGKNLSNPIAMILSAAMLLRIGLKQTRAAEDIERAVDLVLAKGIRTADISTTATKSFGCKEIGNEINNVLLKYK